MDASSTLQKNAGTSPLTEDQVTARVKTLLLTVEQMAAEIPCSKRHLQNMTIRRLVPVIKFGKLVRYDRDAVFRAIEKMTIKEVA